MLHQKGVPETGNVHHVHLNILLFYKKEEKMCYLALIMASTHSTHCSSESHSNRYFLSASSRNASSRNTEVLVNSAITKILTAWRWTIAFCSEGHKKTTKGTQDAAAHLQRRTDRLLSPPYTAPTARLQWAVKSTKNIPQINDRKNIFQTVQPLTQLTSSSSVRK